MLILNRLAELEGGPEKAGVGHSDKGRDTLCDTLVRGVLCAYKDLESHRGLVSY